MHKYILYNNAKLQRKRRRRRKRDEQKKKRRIKYRIPAPTPIIADRIQIKCNRKSTRTQPDTITLYIRMCILRNKKSRNHKFRYFFGARKLCRYIIRVIGIRMLGMEKWKQQQL